MLKAIQEGREAIEEAIEEEFFEKLVKFMEKKVRAVCKAKRWYTKY
jgi:hypothetical protein